MGKIDMIMQLHNRAVAEAYKAGRASVKPVIWKTKGGHNVRIVCTDRAGLFPIIGYFMDSGDIQAWTCHGRYILYQKHKNDLIIPKGFTVGAPDKTEAGEV